MMNKIMLFGIAVLLFSCSDKELKKAEDAQTAGREFIRGQGLFSVDRAAQLVEAAYARWLGERRGPASATPRGSVP